MTASVAVDLSALAAWMRDHGVEVDGDLSARRVGRGQSNLTYRIEDAAGRSWIARRPPLGNLLPSAHDVVREYRILDALQDSGVPVPRLVGVCRDEAVADVPTVVMEHVDGIVIDRMEIAEELSEPVRAEVGLGIARALAAIHEVDVDSVGLGDLASRSPYAERQLRRWTRQWEASRTADRPELDELTALLEAAIPPQTGVSLVHGDFHIRNVIVAPGTGQLRAALDWELSTLGDPVADLGTTLAYWPQPQDTPNALFRASTLPGFPSREDLVAEYVTASGRDVSSLGFWHTLGVWKIAIICEGVYRRTLDNPANTADGGAPTPELVSSVIDHAWEIAVATGLAERRRVATRGH